LDWFWGKGLKSGGGGGVVDGGGWVVLKVTLVLALVQNPGLGFGFGLKQDLKI
jgi:hypothetical protein